MEIKGFSLNNEDKLNRAVLGTIGRGGKLYGGVGENASDEEKLAAYDKLGGLILKGKSIVKMGSFYDFVKGKAKETPEIIFVFRDLDGDAVEVPEGEEVPIEVKAAEIAKANKGKKKKVKRDVEE